MLIIVLIAVYIIRNLLAKVEVLEDNVDQLVEDVQTYDELLTDIKKHANNSYTRMKQIDRLGSFEADDETGAVFNEMLEIIESFNERFN
jgi:hypothetical protein